jgi:MFS family permease
MKAKNLKLFYLHEILFNFSNSLLVIVLPIFLYKLYGSVTMVFIFGLVWNVIHLVTFIPILNLSMKLKQPKYFMAIGVLFYVLSLFMYGQSTSESPSFVILATILFSLYISFYWMLRHWFLSVNSDYKEVGKQMGFLTIIGLITNFIGPLIGAGLSYFFDFNTAFLVGAGMGILSLIPIFLFHAPHHQEYFGWKEVKLMLKQPELKAQRFVFFAEGISSNLIEWPWLLVYFLFIGNILELGYLVAITTLISVLLTKLTGNWFDQRKRTKLLLRLTNLRFLASLLYVSLYFFPNMIYTYLVQTANGFLTTMHETVTNAYIYAHGNKTHPIHFNLNREVYLCLGRILTSVIMGVVFWLLPEIYLWAAIGIGAFFMLGWRSLKNTDHLLH